MSDEALSVEVRCSKGTYIRTLAADIARQLGTLGYVAALRRLAVDPFDAYSMYTLPQLETQRAAGAMDALDPLLLPADTAFLDLGRIELDAAAERSLLLGQTVTGLTCAPCEPLRGYASGGRFLGLVQGQADGRVRALRLFVSVDSH
jgi:tRNA pseudouridine55 synthase